MDGHIASVTRPGKRRIDHQVREWVFESKFKGPLFFWCEGVHAKNVVFARLGTSPKPRRDRFQAGDYGVQWSGNADPDDLDPGETADVG